MRENPLQSTADRMAKAQSLQLLRAANAIINEVQSPVTVLPSQVSQRRKSMLRPANIKNARGDGSAWSRV